MLRGSNICLWLVALVFESGAFCQSYIDIGLPLTARDQYPYSINEKGEIAGYYILHLGTQGDSAPHGFVRAADGTITTFDVPESFFQGMFLGTLAFSINAAGAITGFYYKPQSQISHGFVRDPEGNFTTFDPPGSISTIPQSINAGGDVTGYYNEANLVVHGFVRLDNGTVISFDPPESVATKAVSINAKGAITGYYQDANMRVHGFLRRHGGTIVSFDPPESMGTTVAGINNAGAITGSYTVANGRTFGFVRDPQGRFRSFDPGVNTFPDSINNEGAVTGSYTDANGRHGFVRAPGGSITLIDPLPVSGLDGGCRNPGGLLLPSASPTSINDDGVITGWCNPFTGGFLPNILGWVRYP
jgi:hypothetical protein